MIIDGDAVAAAQRRLRSQHTEDTFDATETVSCLFHQATWAGDQSPMKIGEIVAAHHQFAHRAARLHHTKSLVQGALVAFNFVCKTAVQAIARVVEPLLRVV